MEALNETFGSIAMSSSGLKELQSSYNHRLDTLRDGLSQTLQSCGSPCSQVSLDGVAFSTNFSAVRRGRV